MAFEEIQYASRCTPELQGVRLTVNSSGHRISLAHALTKTWGVVAGDRVSIAIGNGPHAGIIRLEKSEIGYLLGQDAKSSNLRVTVSRKKAPLWTGNQINANFHIGDDNALYITLPVENQVAQAAE